MPIALEQYANGCTYFPLSSLESPLIVNMGRPLEQQMEKGLATGILPRVV